jgi:hypothetical protein
MVDVEELLRMVANLPPEEKEKLLVELGAKKPRRERARKEVPAEVRELVERYQTLRQQLREVRQQLRELGYTPTGLTVRRGYGDYNYRGYPLYNTVKELIQSRRSISREELEEELKKRGYRGLTGTVGVIMKNLKEDGLIKREGDHYVWTGD